jgi:tetratricopeptide (TPR) repeat protein
MDSNDSPKVSASGNRSIAAAAISGVAVSGDNATIDARTIALAPGTIPRPDHVAILERISNLPRPPVRVFVGRDTAMGQLSEALSKHANAVVTQVVFGLGGVGKSELVLQYAQTHSSQYQLVWWITAEDPEPIEAGLALLASRLVPEIGVVGTTQDAAGWALGWLQAHTGWLLVLDNTENLRDIEPLLAQLSGGHILITSRRDVDWQRLANPVRLDILSPEAAAELIITRTGHQRSDDQDNAAAIAAELGYLPLALDQAAAYMVQSRVTPAAYLAKLRQQPERMYASTGGGDSLRVIACIWDISIEAIRQRDPGSVHLLHILAYYAPDGIPRLIIGNTGSDKSIDDALGLLASYSMITLTSETVNIHRLVQAVVLSKPEEPTVAGRSARDTALDWLDAVVPSDPYANVAMWPLVREIVPHVEKLASHYPQGEESVRLGMLLHNTGAFFYSQGNYEQARAFQESALRISENVSGLHHPSTASALENLAIIYQRLGRQPDAPPLLERALKIYEETLGSQDFRTARGMANLAEAYRLLGRPRDALPLQQRALGITQATLDPGHPDIALGTGNLAVIYTELGREQDALPLLEQAQQLTEAAFGPDHPYTAIQLSNLARTYRNLGRPSDALPLSERALRINQALFGQDHDSTGAQLVELADTYRALGRRDDALRTYIQAMEVAQRIGALPADTMEEIRQLRASTRGRDEGPEVE